MPLTAVRDTKRWGGGGPERLHELPMAPSTTIYQGALVGLNASGLLVPMSGTTGLRVVGRAEESKVSGAGQNPLLKVSTGIFNWQNSGTNVVTAANRGQLAYAEDDFIVGNVATGRSAAGKIVHIDSDGVWVDTTPHYAGV